jgi:hypothetical protein
LKVNFFSDRPLEIQIDLTAVPSGIRGC